MTTAQKLLDAIQRPLIDVREVEQLITDALAEAERRGAEQEREACAELAATYRGFTGSGYCEMIAKAIRARGAK